MTNIRFAYEDSDRPVIALELAPDEVGEPTRFVVHERARGAEGGLVSGTNPRRCDTPHELLTALADVGLDDVESVEVVGHVARGPGSNGEPGGIVGRQTTRVQLDGERFRPPIAAVGIEGVGVVLRTTEPAPEPRPAREVPQA